MPQGRVAPIAALTDICEGLRSEGMTIAQCHGAFDFVHPGHLRHLSAAKAMADVLVVTITDDAHIDKGPGQPLFADQLRAEMLAALSVVDYVATCPWATGVEAIEHIRPDLYVKGQDYDGQDQDPSTPIGQERAAVERLGGRMVFTRELQFSTTGLIENLFHRPE